MYKRSRWNTPQALDHCSNADSIGYLDDMFKVSYFLNVNLNRAQIRKIIVKDAVK